MNEPKQVKQIIEDIDQAIKDQTLEVYLKERPADGHAYVHAKGLELNLTMSKIAIITLTLAYLTN